MPLLLYCHTTPLLLPHNAAATAAQRRCYCRTTLLLRRTTPLPSDFPVRCRFDAIAVRQPRFLHLLPLVNCFFSCPCRSSLSSSLFEYVVSSGIIADSSSMSSSFFRMNGHFAGVVLVLRKMCRVEAYWPSMVPPQNNVTLHPFSPH